MNSSTEFVYNGERIGSFAGSSERILVINCGSSSVKYCFYDTEQEARQVRGIVEKIGMEGTRHRFRSPTGEVTRELDGNGFADAFKAVAVRLMTDDDATLGRVTLIVHRVVHGGEKFTEAVLVTDDVLSDIESLSPLAPLHNAINAVGIRETRRLFPDTPHIAVFDTAFHHTLTPKAFLYGLPYDLYKKRGIRRYGFHGTSHRYVCTRAADFLERAPEELRMVSCHLGNGASICAVLRGCSFDISMGFTPSEGLLMGTRCGDLDSGIIAYLERNEGLTPSEVEDLLNRKSGLLGISGLSSDMREILSAAQNGHERSMLALEVYCYRLRKYIGAYAAAMEGLDVIVFTGGVGEGSAEVRARTLKGLHWLGLQIDGKRNRETRAFDAIACISTEDSKVKALVVPTDEERMMAGEAIRVLKQTGIRQSHGANVSAA